MGKAKDIILRPISAKDANALVKRVHYSGKVTQNSQIHIGVFYQGNLEGAMQFGPSLDKRKIQGLVSGTLWNEFIELNRLAFTDVLPRNSESRALSIAFKLLRKHAPQLKWVISFSDATQCGDGGIYRASGFVLTAIKENAQLYKLPFAHDLDEKPLLAAGLSNYDVALLRKWLNQNTPLNGQLMVHKLTVEAGLSQQGGSQHSEALGEVKRIMRSITNGGTSADQLFRLMGGHPAKGYQLRYIYFLDPSYRQRLTVPELPYNKIDELGAGMYRGEKRTHADA